MGEEPREGRGGVAGGAREGDGMAAPGEREMEIACRSVEVEAEGAGEGKGKGKGVRGGGERGVEGKREARYTACCLCWRGGES